MKKLLAIFTCVLLLTALFPITAFAATHTISSGGTYDISSYAENDTINITTSSKVTLTGTKKVSVVCAAGTNLVLSDANINSSGCAISFTGASNTLEIIGTNTVSSGYNEAGIRVRVLTELTISGTGNLTATGGEGGAGIGGGFLDAGGTITIKGGNVTANGGHKGSGIGGGHRGIGGDITIEGGTVTANGGDHGAGIGGGWSATGENITIKGGDVNATGGNYGAGIGGGYDGAGGNITIKGSANVDVTGGEYGAGIGGGRLGAGGDISIESGTVTANGGNYAAGIGGGNSGPGGYITIEGGAITAIGGDEGAGIGGGYDGAGGTITIEDGTVTATGGQYSSGIGGGCYAAGGDITIEGGTVTTTGGGYGAGIGGGRYSAGGNITIKGGDVTATGGDDGAGIGGGYDGAGGDTTIEGGTITATGGASAAGIGGGYRSAGGNITIEGGTVTTTGGGYGAGIGGGRYSAGGNITIKGSANVEATGGYYGAGIGGGNDGAGGNITIEGGTVTATGGDYGAGIGGGSLGASGDIYINNALIFAEGKNTAKDIGAGFSGADGTLSINGTSNVFLKNDEYISSISTTLTHFDVTSVDGDGKICGVEMPSGWSSAGGFISDVYTLTFNANGATGTPPSDISQLSIAMLFNMPTQSGMANGNLKLINWNTATDGSGVGYLPGKQYNINKSDTLYAIWGDTDVSSISISDTELTLKEGGTALLSATVSPADATKNTVSWMTSDGAVAAVSSSGTVTGVGAGTCIVTAEADGKTATCAVTITEAATIPVTTVSLSYGSKSMFVDDVFALTAIVLPDDATEPDVVWDSSDYTVAMVNSAGVVTATGIGTATISATADGVTDNCVITVDSDPDVDVSEVKLTLASDFSAIMYVGDTTVLEAFISPSNATVQSVTWSSSDASVATVTSLGKVTAVAAGDVKITAEAQGKKDTYNITVKVKDAANATETPTLTDEPIQKAEATPTPEEVIVVVEIDVTELPEGTKYIRLPNGDVVEINGEDTLTIEVLEDDLDGSGGVEIIALNDEQEALGSMAIDDMELKTVQKQMADSVPAWKIALVGALMLIVGVGGTLLVQAVVMGSKR